ncbi:hypothetical protein [Neolewinella agarilytica]|uniref:Uncharacterized protein n=1 Tax=Neolewinella agarilytica TaxID=478744 RepID=A0A1H9H7P4_9BACT|nr:hypothetical protein [Neolewinella agarilytica]SEQ58374.1 hypothetical protein SAMN05444359_11250 [Neolewinella agarilytica]
MRLLTLLATAVLLAGCVHDKDDFNLFVAESGASLTHYIGGDGDTRQKSDDDPWDTIGEKYGMGRVYSGKSDDDDPWDTMRDNFTVESVHMGRGKVLKFKGKPVVKMLFVSVSVHRGEAEAFWNGFGELFPAAGNGKVALTLIEVRGEIGRFIAADGRSLFAVHIPADWEPGLVLQGEAYLLDTEKRLPLIGAMVWEVDRNLSEPTIN